MPQEWSELYSQGSAGDLSPSLRRFVRRIQRRSAPEDYFQVADETLAELDGGPGGVPETELLVSALCDLAVQGWRFRIRNGRLEGSAPDLSALDQAGKRARIRAGHLIDRDAQLRKPATQAFLRRMERRGAGHGWHSIFSLMRDGPSLAEALVRQASAGSTSEDAAPVVQPYVQVVDSDTHCEHTGLRLQDIWRYFRHTWTTAYNSIPGRQMSILVRDAAAPHHPVIGIAALGSSIVQVNPRDRWIGWTPEEFLKRLEDDEGRGWARWIEESWSSLLGEIRSDDFLAEEVLSEAQFSSPSSETIARLRTLADDERAMHAISPQTEVHKRLSGNLDNADWLRLSSTHLYRSKRAKQLADLLEVRSRLVRAGFARPNATHLRSVLTDPDGRRALTTLLRYVKKVRVGVAMMDIVVCGAIPPYTHLVGGKLVGLMLTSPTVVQAYRQRYARSPSIIASGLSGRVVQREPRLVLLGTTSLYGVSPNQYDRLSIPRSEFDPSLQGKVAYRKLGRTGGYGSYHLSPRTVRLASMVSARTNRGREVRSIFGEGVNPRFRKARAGLGLIGLHADILRHGINRVVYGVPLAANFREILIARNVRPQYLVPHRSDAEPKLASWWWRRWARNRSERPEIIEQICRHQTTYPVQHGARVEGVEAEYEDLGPLFGRS